MNIFKRAIVILDNTTIFEMKKIPFLKKNKQVLDRSEQELGLSRKANSNQKRLIFEDGKFNVKRTGISPFNIASPFHWLITASWTHFFMIVLGSYFIVNLIFTFLYYLTGVDQLAGHLGTDSWSKFLEAFFFSAQTLTTVGYGRVSPAGLSANIIATFEALIGLLGFAIGTGIMYGRFSRPNANIIFSKNALIAPYKDGMSFQFRTANGRNNQLIEVENQVSFSWMDLQNNKKQFNSLKLETSKIDFYPLNWTVVHVIDENSPLFGWSEEELKERDVEVLVLFKAFDDAFSQTVHTRFSYKYHEIVWGAKFKPMFYVDESSQTILELDKASDYELTPLYSSIN